jgi:hypothetical protein
MCPKDPSTEGPMDRSIACEGAGPESWMEEAVEGGRETKCDAGTTLVDLGGSVLDQRLVLIIHESAAHVSKPLRIGGWEMSTID